MRCSFFSPVWVVALICFAATASAADKGLNTLTPEEQNAGWKLLFDGKSTAGWRNYQQDKVSPGWTVADGALTRAEKDAGDIITDGEYGAFELTLDYNIAPAGNSGLMYHVKETEKRPWQTGPEVQIQDNKEGHDPQKAGWLYQFYSSDVDATKPAGQWNTLRLVITPEKCEHYMNGVKYFEYVKGSKEWNELYEKSKFKAFPNFGKATSGHICLQDHGNLVSYRNIKIRDLSKAPKVEAPKAAPTKTEGASATPTAPATTTQATTTPATTQQTTTNGNSRRTFAPLRRIRNAISSLR